MCIGLMFLKVELPESSGYFDSTIDKSNVTDQEMVIHPRHGFG